MKNRIEPIIFYVEHLFFFLIFFLTPLIFWTKTSELFEFNKMIFVYMAAIISGACWAGRMIIKKQIIFKRTFWDMPLFLFFASQFLATVFSMDVYTSFFGYYSRFHLGLLSLTAFLILYWAFVSNFGEEIRINRSDYINRLMTVIIISSLIVSVYGVAQHFGIDFFAWVQDVKTRVFSTLGQPNWLGAYLAVSLLVTAGFFLQKINEYGSETLSNFKFLIFNFKLNFKIKNLKSIILIFLILSLFYACLLFTRSRSAFLAFHVCFFIYTIICVGVSHGKPLQNTVRKTFIATYLIFFILINVFNIFPAPMDELSGWTIPNLVNKYIFKHNSARSTSAALNAATAGEGGTESFAIRRIVWQGAWNAFVKNPIFGTGVETFAYAYYKYKPLSQNMVSEWDFLYNKTHNEYLNYLATTGIVGTAAYFLLIISFIFFAVKTIRNPDNHKRFYLNLALLLAWSTILITNFFGFSVVAISLFFYLIPALLFVINQNVNIKMQSLSPSAIGDGSTKLKINRSGQLISLFCLSIFTLYLLFSIFNWWRADVHFATAKNFDDQNQVSKAFDEYKAAINLSPIHPNYHSEFALNLGAIAESYSAEDDQRQAQVFAKEAVAQSDLAITISPQNVVFWNNRAILFNNLSFVDKNYAKEAVYAINKAKSLAPADPKIAYYASLINFHEGKKQQAFKLFAETEKLKPDYIQAIAEYARILYETGEKNEAMKKLQNLLKYYPGNPGLTKLIESYQK